MQYSSGVFALTKPKDCEFRKENSKSILKEKPNFIKAGLMYLKKIQVFLAQVGSVDLNHINRKVNGVSLPFYHPSILRNFPTTFSVFFICTDTLNVSTLKLRRKGSQLYRLGRGFKSINL